jgi:hypothetical protein
VDDIKADNFLSDVPLSNEEVALYIDSLDGVFNS